MKISLVTPVFNMERYLKETIHSVLDQCGDFDIEYILINDGSTDSSEKIILDTKKCVENGSIKPRCNSIKIIYVQQENAGMYSAINKGFSLATGDIYAWIGGDDLYRPNTAFASIVTWFKKNPSSLWVKGMCGLIDVDGKTIRHGRDRKFKQNWIAQGIYGRETYFIEQESVFWKSELWKKVAPIPSELRAAGDYWLWIQFAKYSPLQSIPVQVAYFRIRPGQISSNRTRYKNEQHTIYPKRSSLAYIIRICSILRNTFR